MNCINIKSGESFRTLLVSSSYDFPEHSSFSADGFEVSSGHGQAMHISLESNASADILALIMPGSDTKMDFRIELAGPGAACRLFGLYLCPDAEQASINVELVHKTHHCSSHQLFKGIVSGTARTGFYGKIIVEPDAQATEAYQENHSLLLSDAAKADTQPQLEIYADDVKCSHGATVGKLNEDEQFYMRSRGIPENEAKVLQMFSFISSVMDVMPEGEAKEKLSYYVEQAVRNSF